MSLPPSEPERNPYAPPEAEIGEAAAGAPGDLAEAEAVRRAHITHEMSIRSLGDLHLVGGIVGLIGLTVFAAVAVGRNGEAGYSGPVPWPQAVSLFFVTGINLALVLGLRELRPWARWLDVALIGFTLLLDLCWEIRAAIRSHDLFDLGLPLTFSIILGHILYLLLSPRATVVFSQGYKEIIARTPHVKMKTSWLVKGGLILLLAFLLVVVGGVVSFVFGGQ